jgi:hypothetical protein
VVGGRRIVTPGAPYPPEPIDALYYIEHTMMNPLDLIFSLAYKNDLAPMVLARKGYKPQYTRQRFIGIDHPVGIFYKIARDAGTLPVQDRVPYVWNAINEQSNIFNS